MIWLLVPLFMVLALALALALVLAIVLLTGTLAQQLRELWRMWSDDVGSR